jgi:thioesterase domain-containing protein
MGSIPSLRRAPRQVVAEDDTTLVDQVQFAASLKYQARPWPGAALLFRSSEQPTGKFLPSDMGWSHVLTEKSDMTLLPGDHRKIFDDPGAQIIAASVKAFLSGQPAPIPPAAQTHSNTAAVSEEPTKSCALIGF